MKKRKKEGHLADVIWPKACYNMSFLWQLWHKVCHLLTLRIVVKFVVYSALGRNVTDHLNKTLNRILANHASHTFSRSVYDMSFFESVQLIECSVKLPE